MKLILYSSFLLLCSSALAQQPCTFACAGPVTGLGPIGTAPPVEPAMTPLRQQHDRCMAVLHRPGNGSRQAVFEKGWESCVAIENQWLASEDKVQWDLHLQRRAQHSAATRSTPP